MKNIFLILVCSLCCQSAWSENHTGEPVDAIKTVPDGACYKALTAYEEKAMTIGEHHAHAKSYIESFNFAVKFEGRIHAKQLRDFFKKNGFSLREKDQEWLKKFETDEAELVELRKKVVAAC